VSGPPRAVVYPAFNALYYSFYLAGLREVRAVRYRRGAFPAFGHHALAFETGEPPVRILISASDGPVLQSAALAWCHVYGKINLDPSQVPAEHAARCLAIGPSFPVRLWGPPAAFARGLANLARCRGRVESPREHFANFWRQYVYRLPLAAYEPVPGEAGYVFTASTLWKKEAATNRYRASFVEACRSLHGLEVEGGFAPRRGTLVPGFEHVTASRRYPPAEYLAKTKRSTVVFNTPAVASCHGWKLGEFLALGKAIVSTAPARALPAPLEHGVHLHYVDGSVAAIRSAVERIVADADYRRRLEENARAYYLRYLSPTRVLERLLHAAEIVTE
jgi:hypothetical protein